MGIMALSHKYKALQEFIFQADSTEIGTGFIEAQEEKDKVFSLFFFLIQQSCVYTNSTVYIHNFKQNFIISSTPVLWLARNALT